MFLAFVNIWSYFNMIFILNRTLTFAFHSAIIFLHLLSYKQPKYHVSGSTKPGFAPVQHIKNTQ